MIVPQKCSDINSCSEKWSENESWREAGMARREGIYSRVQHCDASLQLVTNDDVGFSALYGLNTTAEILYSKYVEETVPRLNCW